LRLRKHRLPLIINARCCNTKHPKRYGKIAANEAHMEKCKVSFDALQWQSPLTGVRYKVFQQGSHRLRLVEFSCGFVEPDWCINGHIG
jgi:hypothetical protein